MYFNPHETNLNQAMQISILAIEKRVMLLYWPLGTDPYFFEEGLRQLLKQNSCTAKTVACVAGAGGRVGEIEKQKGRVSSLSFFFLDFPNPFMCLLRRLQKLRK